MGAVFVAGAFDDTGTATCDIGAYEYDGTGSYGEPFYVLGTAYKTGYGGTHWRSDLEIHNRSGAQASFAVQLLPWGQANLSPVTQTYTLDADKSVRFANVVSDILGFTGSATIRVLPSRPNLLVGSRTFNDAASGTYGQYIPGLGPSQAWGPGAAPRIIMLSQSTSDTSGFRTNLTLANVGALPVTVTAQYFAAGGTSLGTQSYPLGAFESQQVDRCFRAVTASEVTDGYIVLSTATPGGRFVAGAHVIDQSSGDPLFVPAV